MVGNQSPRGKALMKRSKHPLYHRWIQMIARCHHPQCDRYKWYGARGICVCRRWRTFNQFVSEMGIPPFPGATVERVDRNSGYNPNNCIWCTQKQQMRNTSANHNLTVKEKTQCIKAWAEEIGVPRTRIRDRIRLGWNHEDAVYINRGGKILEWQGQRRCMKEWAEILSIKPITLYSRIRLGWSVSEALSRPVHSRHRGEKL